MEGTDIDFFSVKEINCNMKEGGKPSKMRIRILMPFFIFKNLILLKIEVYIIKKKSPVQ